MADEIDRACEREQLDRERAIAAALSAAAAPVLPACGVCYNCESSVPAGMRFCDADCLKDWQDRKNAEVRRGLVYE